MCVSELLWGLVVLPALLALKPVVNAIQRINPVDSLVCFVNTFHWIEIYPVDIVIQPSNNWGLIG